jgi:predicted transcriptional regulator of viral defense system
MQYLDQAYYVGLLSAAQFYGAAHQQPQQFQVIVEKTRLRIHCGQAHIVFIARKDVHQIPVQDFNTHYGIVRVSTATATARDLVVYSQHCGGVEYVATLLSELSEKIDAAQLTALVQSSREVTWVQRLGYLFDWLEQPQLSEMLQKAITGKRLQPCLLEPHVATHKGEKNKKWQVWANIHLELEI